MVGTAARAVLSGLAVFALSPEAFRAKQHTRRTGNHAQLKHDPVKGQVVAFNNGCTVPELVFSGLRSVVNGAWAKLEEHDPVSLRVAGNHSLSLFGCGVELDVDAGISLAGFSEGGVRQLSCSKATCVETAADGTCANTEYEFSAHLSVGDCKDTLKVAGGVDADWNLCGKNIPRHQIDASFDIVDPGMKIELTVQYRGGLDAKVTNVATLDLDWGVPTNFKCGFEGLGLVGGLLSNWCQSLMEWVAARIQEHLQGDVDTWLHSLMNLQFKL